MLINIWVGCKTVNIKARKSLYVYDANFIITIKKTYNTVWHTLQTLINFIIDFSDLISNLQHKFGRLATEVKK